MGASLWLKVGRICLANAGDTGSILAGRVLREENGNSTAVFLPEKSYEQNGNIVHGVTKES